MSRRFSYALRLLSFTKRLVFHLSMVHVLRLPLSNTIERNSVLTLLRFVAAKGGPLGGGGIKKYVLPLPSFIVAVADPFVNRSGKK